MNFVKTLLSSVLVVAVVGCSKNNNETDMENFFAPADNHRKVNQMISVQADAGAQQDGTLEVQHFTGKRLNSLGLTKLDRLVPLEPDMDVVVYLNLPVADPTTSVREDVLAYLGECGIEESHVKIESGPNPGNLTPSGVELQRFSKTESGEIVGGSNGTGAAMAPVAK